MSSLRLSVLALLTFITGTVLAGNLTVTIAPAQAATAGGQWRVDGGVWRNSGATVKNLTDAAHPVEYKAITGGWVAPGPVSVTLAKNVTTTITGTYASPASLNVTLNPASGQWNVDGGAWRTSGTTVTGLTPGAHTVSYNLLPNQIQPPTESTTLVSGQTTSLSRSYTPAGQVFVMLNPSNAQWRVDGGIWRATHTYSDLIAAGPHTIECSPLPGLLTPPAEIVTVVAGQVLNVSKDYTAESALTVNLSPAIGQWRIDSGAWQNSGTRVGQLNAGSHAVEYTAVAGYSAPPSETVFLGTGSAVTIGRSYLQPASLTVNVTPSQGQWRVVGGAWQASGATLNGLRPGNYGVEFSSVAGYFDVPTSGVTLGEVENKTISYTHTRHATITATLAPGTGQWRMNGGAWLSSGTTVGALYSGNYTIDYSAVAGMTTPPSESFYLNSGEQKSLSHTYGGAPSLTINLSPAGGQWRVDGGAWQAGGSVMFNIAFGSHLVEYAPLPGYISPNTETLWFRQNQSLNLSRNYLGSSAAYLAVKTVPSYLAETGAISWRLDGGAWNLAGAPAAVTPGTHTLEFQPVAGIDVPPSSTVTANAGAVATVEATFYFTHRLRLFLHPDLVAGLSTADLQARLSQYAADLQTIWQRESNRRFTFNPATDISIVSVSPFSHNAFPPVPEFNFEVWAYADSSNGSIYGSNGGYAAMDVGGAGGADGMHWTQIYDPSTLAPDSTELREYWKQINAMTHEFEHVFGAGLGEYYSANFSDNTGLAPLYSVDYFTPADPFWNSHSDFWPDPLLRSAYDNYRIGNPTARPALLDAVHFSATSRGIINGCYRNADSSSGRRTALPDLSRIQIKVVDSTSGALISGATLRIWNRQNPGPTSGQERTVVPTSTPGVFEFNWTADASFTPLNNWDNGKLLKAFANGYQSKAQWEWIYDAQRVKTVDNSDVWEITVALDPAP
jgi:hypothetical protein